MMAPSALLAPLRGQITTIKILIIMTYDIYYLGNIGGMITATYCLAQCKDEQELEEWRKSNEAIKGHYIVIRNWH